MEEVLLGVIIPTYNERENIVKLLDALHEKLDSAGVSFKILIVDDNSPDGTAEIVKKYMKKTSTVSIIVRECKKGLGSAIMDGFRAIMIDDRITHVATMDADGSHNPEDLVKMLMKAREADLVQGSRYVTGGEIIGWGAHRRLISWSANFIVRLLFGRDIKDYTSNFRVYSRRLVKKILEYKLDDSYDWVVESIVLAKLLCFRVIEVPITFVNRKEGSSKLGFSDIVRWFVNILKIKGRVKDLVIKANKGEHCKNFNFREVIN